MLGYAHTRDTQGQMYPPVEIRIIATEANDRGDLFGRLMSDLFFSLGYDNVRLNIARSGREIDIEAEHRFEARRAIAECKALDEKVGGTEVNKLAGKLRPERNRRSGHGVAGYFISLSGFPGTAIDQEDEAGHEAVILIDGPQVVSELIKGRVLVSVEVATSQAGKTAAEYTQLSLDDAPELLAHKMGWLWVVYYCQGKQRTHFVFVDASFDKYC
jgi:Restriction endonuclease